MAALSSTDTRIAHTRGGEVSYLEAGEGPALVLLHGVGSSARSWRSQLETLSPRHRVIAWNAPGYGASSHVAQDKPCTDDYADALLALVDTLGLARLHLVGHSLGALIAGRFAARHPDRLATLQLASCALGHARYDGERRAALLKSRLDDVTELGIAGMAQKRGPNLLTPAAPADMRATVVDTMASLDPRGYSQAAYMLSTGDLLSDIAAINPRVPLHVLYGAEDRITPPQANQDAAAARAHTRITEIPAAGHAVYIEQADAFSRAVADFAGATPAQAGQS